MKTPMNLQEIQRKEEALRRVGNWLIKGDTGASSLSLCGVYLGSDYTDVSHPHDFGDFERCVLFLQKLNAEEVDPLLKKMATRSPSWEGIQKNWSELVRLYNKRDAGLYKILKKLDLPGENEIRIEL